MTKGYLNWVDRRMKNLFFFIYYFYYYVIDHNLRKNWTKLFLTKVKK